MSQRTAIALVVVAAAACALGACERQKSAAEVQSDTRAAEQSAAQVDEQAEQRVASALDSLSANEREVEHRGAIANEQVADTQARGTHEVAVAHCEALGSDAERSCRAQADSDYAAAKALAHQRRAEADPNL